MCLAIPMRVLELSGTPGSLEDPPCALVEVEGVGRKVRLDIVDRQPAVGDYVIVHAGFAIHCLEPEEARENLAMLRGMAAAAKDS